MSDNRLDDKFVDQAWEHMRQLLDQEMPEEKKSRRLVVVPWWGWSAAASVLLLISAAVAWQFWSVSSSAPVAAREKAGLSIASANEECNEPDANTVVAQVRRRSSGAARPAQKTPLSALKKLIPAAPQPATLVINSEKTSAYPILETETSLDNNTFLLPEGKNTSAVIESSDILTLDRRTPPNLPYALRLANETPSPSPLPPFEPTEVEKSAKNWKLGLEFGTHASGGSAVGGFSGGAVVQMPAASDKWRLRLGLNYTSLQNSIDIQRGSATADAFAESAQNRGGVAPNSVDVKAPEFRLTTHQLNLPAVLEYRAHRYLSVEGGLQGAYLLTARNLEGAERYQTVMISGYVPPTVKGFVNTLQSGTNGEVDIQQLYRWNVFALAGVTVYPTPKLGVRLQYQHGLRDILKDSDFSAFNHNFRVGAVYFFK